MILKSNGVVNQRKKTDEIGAEMIMPTIYSTLSPSKQCIYKDLQKKLEAFQISAEYQNVSFECVSEVFKAVLEDHPELFWLSGAASGTTKTIGGRLASAELRPELLNSMSIELARKEKLRFDKKVDELIMLARRHSYNLYEQILFLHDYMVVHTDYKLNAPHCYDAYGGLILGMAVCAGYAAAFHVLMNKLGVECGRVRGSSSSAMTGEASHAWNYIKLSDGFYFVDVTWDDPVVSNGVSRNSLSYEYFCLNGDEIRLTHRFLSNQFIPNSFGHKYDYYRYHGLYTERYSFEAVKEIARKQLVHGDAFSVKLGSQNQLKSAVRDLMDNQRVYSIPGVSGRISYHTSRSGLVLTISVL